MRKMILFVMIIALMIPAGQAFAADTTKSIQVSFAPLHYILDETEYSSPEGQSGFIYQDNTYVPLRFVGTILNKTIAWDGKTSKVTVAAPKSGDWVGIRKYLSAQEVKDSNIQPVDSSTIPLTSIEISTREISYEFDGEQVAPDPKTPGFIYEGSTYVPLRFMYETLGFDPTFDKGTYTITSNTDEKQLVYQTIVKSSDELIVAEKAVCTDKVTAIYRTYITTQTTITSDEKAALTEEATTLLTGCRANLVAMLDELSTQLTDGDHPTTVVDEYLVEIDALETFARDLLKKYQ